MIKTGNNESNKPENSGLDSLVDSLCKVYDIPTSLVLKMKSGLEDTLYDYLKKFITDNNLNKVEESNAIEYDASDDSKPIDKVVSEIIESTRLNGVVSVKKGNSELIRLTNVSESMTYSIAESLDASGIDCDHLVEAWECEDVEDASSLIYDIIKLSRKED